MPVAKFAPSHERARLLRAGRALLARHGYAGLRVDDVLDEAGLSTRAFYRHFAGKAELFLTLFDEEMEASATRLAKAVTGAGGPEAQVAAWISAVLALAYDTRLAPRTRMFAAEREVLDRQFPDEVERCVRLQLAPLEQAIAIGRDAGAFPDADPARDARAIHHLCAGFLSERLTGSTPLAQKHATALASGFALQTLRADGTERSPR